MTHGEGPSDACYFCGSRCRGYSALGEIPVCEGCRGRPCFVAVAGPRPPVLASPERPLRPANPVLLAHALVSLREFVLRDDEPEARERPKYLTSSTPTSRNTETDK